MTVSDLFRRFTWTEVRSAMLIRYPNAHVDLLQATFSNVCGILVPSVYSIEVSGIQKDDSTIEIFGLHGGEEYTLHFCTMKEWACMRIKGAMLIKHELMNILVAILHEMTLSGYNDEEIEMSFADILSRSTEVGCTTEELSERMHKKFAFLK